ncbi:MAG: hypothetical protein AAF576_00015 [Pseudomonadota bacterium]
MGPLRLIRMVRMARRPPSWTRIMIVLGVCAIAVLIIGGEWLLGLELPEREMNWRRGPRLDVAN